jgi:hypothetical protein
VRQLLGNTSGIPEFTALKCKDVGFRAAIRRDLHHRRREHLDGQYVATMTVIPPPLSAASEDPSVGWQREQIRGLMESGLNETLDRLCKQAETRRR